MKRHWVAEMGSAMPGRQFVDRQVDGPFASWEHVHRFVPIDDERSELLDHVEYSLPAGGLTDAVGEGPAGKTLSRLFRFRHERTRLDLGRHAEWADRPRLKVAIAGASGLIGSHLADYLTTAGHTRHQAGAQQGGGTGRDPWDPATGALYHGALEGVDAIVNLAAVSLEGIWTSGRKKAILDSRVQTTRTLAEAIARMDSPPSVFISVSGGSAPTGLGAARRSPSRRLAGRDSSPTSAGSGRRRRSRPGKPASAWSSPARAIVMSAAGGALPAMLPAFKAGLGARLGDGDQYWSWLALDDLLAAFEWALHDEELEGVVNFTAPEPVTNREVTRTLGRVLRRPAALAAPAFLLRHGMGGMGDEMLLASQRAVPARLKEQGFRFAFPELEGALRYELGRT